MNLKILLGVNLRFPTRCAMDPDLHWWGDIGSF